MQFSRIDDAAGYEIRDLQRQDIPEILALLDLCLGTPGIPRTAEFWEWKHEKNPFGPSPAIVAVKSGKIIGIRIFMQWRWRLQDRAINAVRAVDTVTHPEWQGKGLFSRLTSTLLERLEKQGVAFVFNTPNRFSRPGYLKMGWKPVTRLPLWFRIKHPIRAARLLLSGSERIEKELTAERSKLSDDLDLNQIRTLLNSPTASNLLQTDRTIEYLRWRYLEIPGFEYSWELGQEGNDYALIVWRNRRRKNLSELSISELLLTPGPNAIPLASRLIKRVVSGTEADYVVAIGARGAPETIALQKSGFLPVPKVGPILTIKQIADKTLPLDLSDWSSWRCSIGDLEIF